MKAICAWAILFLATPCVAENWYAGGGLGLYDVDREQLLPGEFSAHFNSPSANLFVGYSRNRYLGAEVQFEYIREGSETDPDGFRSEFSGYSVSPSIVARYPLDEKDLFEVFVRGGLSYIDYTMANISLGHRISDSNIQPVFGIGLRTTHYYVEYVNYGEQHDMDLDQVRFGVRIFFHRSGGS